MDMQKKDEFTLSFMTGSTASEHMHQDVEFIFVVDGVIRVTALEKTFTLKAEDVLIINSNHRHSWLELEKSHVFVMHFCYSMLLEYLGKKLLFFYCNSTVEADDRYSGLRTIMDDLLSECAVNMDRMTFCKKSIIYRLLNFLVNYFMADDISSASNKEDIRVERMLQYINTNYNRVMTLQEMAEFMYMAPSSFSRFFKRRVGMTFVEYVNNVRLHFALEDIRYTNNSMSWIAHNHGFSNASAFCRIFKEAYGMSPMAYRKKVDPSEERSSPVEMDRQFLKKYVRQNDKKVWHSWKTQFAQVNVDCCGEKQKRMDNPWTKGMNLGNAFELLSADLQQQIVEAKKELGFAYGRISDIFSARMLLRSGHTPHITNFTYMDQILDFLVAHQIRPMIGLDNKPRGIRKGINSPVYEIKSEIIFEDMEEYRQVLGEFLEHIVYRYGMREVGLWMFECWYDEYYENTMGISGPFVRVFSEVYRQIKSRIPRAAVGGCELSIAISETKFRKLIEHWSSAAETPDFVSICLLPYSRVNEDGQLKGKRRLNTDDYYRTEVVRCREIINEFGWNKIPLYVTEWNMSMSQRSYFNESCGKAALMLQRMCQLKDYVNFAAWMKLSDFSSIYYDTDAFLNGGYGLVNASGVRKPAYYALMFMSRLGQYVIASDKNYIITTDGFNEYTILCFNAKQLRYKYYARDEDNIRPDGVEDIFEDTDSLELTFTLKNMEDGIWHMKEYRISPDHGSVLEEWLRLGSNEDLDAEDARYLKEICVPNQKNGSLRAVNGNLVFLQTLKACEIKMIKLFKSNIRQ